VSGFVVVVNPFGGEVGVGGYSLLYVCMWMQCVCWYAPVHQADAMLCCATHYQCPVDTSVKIGWNLLSMVTPTAVLVPNIAPSPPPHTHTLTSILPPLPPPAIVLRRGCLLH